LATGYWLLITGYWLLAIGYWLPAIGYWPVAAIFVHMADHQWEFGMADIREVARQWWVAAGDARVFAFHGDMGAGKTTFIHALCEVKGVRDTVGSPTFSLVNQYAYTVDGEERPIYHIDLYRIADEEEAIRAGMEDCLWSGSICFVEWPERATGIFPPGTLRVDIMPTSTAKRKLILYGNGDNH
jgi:tRNA threonylcarbamoyladenosine biosynthesis protein TsaE